MLGRLSDFIKTFRLEQILVVYSVLLFGVFASSHTPNWSDYLVLALLSVSGHIFGYGLNDLIDQPYDRFKAMHRKRRATIHKSFNRTGLLTITLLQIPVILFIWYLAYGFGESSVFVALALLSVAIYDLFGKTWGRLVLIPHFFFPLSLVFLCLGGYTLFDPVAGIRLPFLLLLATLFLNSILANSIQAGLYDLKGDQEAGVTTVAILTGSGASGEYLRINRNTRIAGYTLFLMNIPVIIAQAVLNGLDFWIYGIMLSFFLFAYIHLANLLRIKKNRTMLRYDVIGSSAYVFYAASLAWIHNLPWLWWFIIVFQFLYPFIRNHPAIFGRWTLIEFVKGRG
ncbi:MAG: UbiA family prenyltransferase [Bacteroidota bacterium]